MSLLEFKGTPKATTYKKATPSVGYKLAVAQVSSAKKGTLISRAETRTAVPSVPKALTSPIEFFGAATNVFKGTKEGAVLGASAFMPTTIVTTPAYDIRTGSRGMGSSKPLVDVIAPKIKEFKKDEKAKEFWESPSAPDILPVIPDIKLPDIKLPEFPDIFGGLKEAGKWILIGGVVLVGIYLFARGSRKD